MKTIAYRIIAESMIIAEVDTAKEAREMVAEFKRNAKVMGEPVGSYEIEKVRW